MSCETNYSHAEIPVEVMNAINTWIKSNSAAYYCFRDYYVRTGNFIKLVQIPRLGDSDGDKLYAFEFNGILVLARRKKGRTTVNGVRLSVLNV